MPRKATVTADIDEPYEPKDDVCKRPRGPLCTCGCHRPKRECEAFQKMRANPSNRNATFLHPEANP